jgi:phosphatidylserine decarboxylase
MLHREGKSIFAILIGSLILLIWAVGQASGIWSILLWFLLAFVVFMLVFSIQFFRNPKRPISSVDNSKIYSPADGKVVVIEETVEHEYFKDKRLQVSIFMSPLNVHANRVPVSGKVQLAKYHKGKYLVAWHPKSSTENERTTTVIKTADGKEILVRQIAGAVARRIRNYMSEGQAVTQGEELGFIKFGSRSDIFLPVGTKVTVELDQMVKGNIDVIAEW